MFKFQTKCDGCVYKKEDSGCEFEIDSYQDCDNKQYTKGFCKYKRKNGNKSKQEIEQEESSICLMINCKDRDVSGLVSFLYDEDLSLISEIVIFGNSITLYNGTEDIFEALKTLKTPWSLRVFSQESEDMESYAVKEISHCSWYLLQDVDETIDHELIKHFNNLIEDNFVQIKSKVNTSFIRNRFAFMELECNHVQSFDEKLKQLTKESNNE